MLDNFDPGTFESHGDEFIDIMVKSIGVHGEEIGYIIRYETLSTTISTEEEERMYQLKDNGNKF